MSDEQPKARERCSDCGGICMGPIYWVDEAQKDEKICRRGRVVFSSEELDGEYRCDGSRFQTVTFTAGPQRPHDAIAVPQWLDDAISDSVEQGRKDSHERSKG